VDGRALAERLDGTALQVDPGPHEYTFAAGDVQTKLTFDLKEGEKGRHERIVLAKAATAPPPMASPDVRPVAPSPSPPALAETTAPGDASGLGTQKILALSLGGVGAASLGVGTVFGLLSGSAWSSAKSVCGGNASECSNVSSGQSHRNTAESDATIATAGFISGGALLAAGAVLFLTAGSQERGPAASVGVFPTLGPGEAGLAWSGRF
jgi:hypothetical protein